MNPQPEATPALAPAAPVAPVTPPAAAPPATAAVQAEAPSQQDDATPMGSLAHQSIDDAYILLNFACRKGKSLDNAATKVIIACHNKKTADTPLTADEENAFWDAFSKVIDAVKPVTVDSIVYTTAKSDNSLGWLWGRLSRGERALRRHLYLATITLLALLFLQVQWAMGTAIYNDAFQVHTHLQEAETTVTDAQNMVASVADTDAEAQAKITLEKAQGQLKVDTSWNNVSYLQLWWWNRQVIAWVPVNNLDISTAKQADDAKDTIVTLTDKGKERAEFTRAELTLKVISNYFLVALFALLGAVTQALRTLSRAMAEVSLTSNEVFRGITRIILGVISGVCMAWLYLISAQTPETSSAIRAPLDVITFFGAFAPWALAFISGYSVEIFFTALERFIVIVTAKIKGLTPLPGEKISQEAVQQTDAAPAPQAASATAPQSQSPPVQTPPG